MGVARNVVLDPRLVPGGGATEMAISRGLQDRASALQGTEQAHALLTALKYTVEPDPPTMRQGIEQVRTCPHFASCRVTLAVLLSGAKYWRARSVRS